MEDNNSLKTVKCWTKDGKSGKKISANKTVNWFFCRVVVIVQSGFYLANPKRDENPMFVVKSLNLFLTTLHILSVFCNKNMMCDLSGTCCCPLKHCAQYMDANSVMQRQYANNVHFLLQGQCQTSVLPSPGAENTKLVALFGDSEAWEWIHPCRDGGRTCKLNTKRALGPSRNQIRSFLPWGDSVIHRAFHSSLIWSSTAAASPAALVSSVNDHVQMCSVG